MIQGYGPKFPGLEELFKMEPSIDWMIAAESPLASLGRYRESVEFLKDITSGKSIAWRRFRVGIRYFIFLSDLLDSPFDSQKKVVGEISSSAKKWLLTHAGQSSVDAFRAEVLERVAEHDTAAAMDYLKLVIAKQFPDLEEDIEGVHFGNTSEDVMGIVFGTILNELVLGHLLKGFVGFSEAWMAFVDKHETDEQGAHCPLVLPGLTHQQAAEPTTLGKKVSTRLFAMWRILHSLRKGSGNLRLFSGKLNGAIGNYTTHMAAYPEISWLEESQRFVEGFGLNWDEMTDQCVSYDREAQIFLTIANTLTQIIKLVQDFVNLCACPAQLFVKKKRAGNKGSSIMPNKSNLWAMEGALEMLRGARANLVELALRLPEYPHEGDMKRSFPMRDIGNTFAPIFIALGRITGELEKCQPNHRKIKAFLDEYPGMAGSALQTILKRAGVKGDAYRAIQEISINPDSSYANREEFARGLEEKMEVLQISESLRQELRDWLDLSKFVKMADYLASNEFVKLRQTILPSFKAQAERQIKRKGGMVI